jgi:ABC-type Zn uptake system ZnuABC Zn-binding protein ZnuA
MAVALTLTILSAPATAAGPLSVVTTTTDLKSLVESVGGDRARVVSLAPPVHEPHQVDVKPRQLAELKAADLIVRIGLDHEPWLAGALRAVGNPRFAAGGDRDLDLSRGIALLQSETSRARPEHGVHVHGFGNTHYWLDPENARPMTAAIQEALTRLDPVARSALARNREQFLSRLDAGLARWTSAVAPYRGVKVVVVHETWPYFARRFGLVVVGALEPTPGVPPSPAYLASLIERMKSARVSALIAGPESDWAAVERVVALSGARPVTLVSSVGGDPEATDYVSLFDVNIRRLAEAFAALR